MVQLHLGVMLLGVSGLFAKLIDLPALDIIAYRSFCTALLLFVLLKLFKQPVRLRSWRDYKVAIILGVLAAVHWLTYFMSIQMTSVAVGMIALFTYPVVTVLIEPLFRRQLPHLKDISISLIVLFGISLLFPGLWDEAPAMSEDYVLGIILGVVSAVTFALRNIGIQHYFSGYSGMHGMFYQFTVTAILFLPFVGTLPLEITSHDWQLLLICTVFFTAAPHVLFAGSISKVSAKTAGLVACLQPLYGTFLGLILLSEVPNTLTLIGGLIVLCAALFETLQSGKTLKDKGR
jgi:drug/metabolite transporter (DMT)-like permease